MRTVNDFDLKLLNLFVTIVDSGGFSAAQSKLNLHQSTISTRMSQLESRIGMILCHRGRRGFYLTSDGENVYKLSQKIFSQISDFEEELDNIRSISNAHVKLILTDNMATNPNCKINKAIKLFCNKYPKVTLETNICDSYKIEMMILDEHIELGITSSEIHKKGLTYIPLFQEKQFLYCSPEHPILQLEKEMILEQIAKFNLIDRGLSHKITPLHDLDNAMHLASSVNMEATAHLILSGNFIGYLPNHYADIWVKQGEMVKIEAPGLEYTADFHLTILTSAELSLAARKLRDTLINVHVQNVTS